MRNGDNASNMDKMSFAEIQSVNVSQSSGERSSVHAYIGA